MPLARGCLAGAPRGLLKLTRGACHIPYQRTPLGLR